MIYLSGITGNFYCMKNVYYVSKEGLDKLNEELERRKTVLRKKITEAIGTAKDQGDLSENFEYHDAKDRQAVNESRIIELNDTIAKTVIIQVETGGTEIQIGTTFEAEIGSVKKTFSIVGETESDPMSGKISHESPLGNAFMGHGVGDVIEIETPAGKMSYKIISLN